MLKSNCKNEEGVIFVTVLIIIISMMILATAVVNIQLNQSLVSEREIQRIQREVLATGALHYYLANQFSSDPSTNIYFSENSGGISYAVNIVNEGPSALTNTLTIEIN